jgi:hypothetical protein
MGKMKNLTNRKRNTWGVLGETPDEDPEGPTLPDAVFANFSERIQSPIEMASVKPVAKTFDHIGLAWKKKKLIRRRNQLFSFQGPPWSKVEIYCMRDQAVFETGHCRA